MKQQRKTKDYTKRAIEKYDSKFKRITVRLPKDIESYMLENTEFEKLNSYINYCVAEDMKRREQAHTAPDSLTGINAHGIMENAPGSPTQAHSGMISPDYDLLDIDPEELPFH